MIDLILNHIWLTIILLIIILLVVRSLLKSPSQKRFNKNLMRQVPYLFARYFT